MDEENSGNGEHGEDTGPESHQPNQQLAAHAQDLNQVNGAVCADCAGTRIWPRLTTPRVGRHPADPSGDIRGEGMPAGPGTTCPAAQSITSGSRPHLKSGANLSAILMA